MEIPYTVRPRPDTGLANPKLGIWLFLASEVMLFGGLFACYIFMRIGSEPWMWPHGWLNVPVGTFNTFILILSSVTIILSWECLKMRKFAWFKIWLGATWACGLLFLGVKLAYEWPTKFSHFGAYVTKEAAPKYEKYLGNKDTTDAKGSHVDGHETRKRYPRLFIGGHLEHDDKFAMESASVPFVSEGQLNAVLAMGSTETDPVRKAKMLANREKALAAIVVRPDDIKALKDPNISHDVKANILHRMNSIHVHMVDAENADPYDASNDDAHFVPRAQKEAHGLVIEKADLYKGHGAFVPKLNTYLATYFMITGLHGAHVLAGCIVFIYFWLPIKGGTKLYTTNHQQLCNRIEVSGLFWHLVDLIWIFVFPLFYLL